MKRLLLVVVLAAIVPAVQALGADEAPSDVDHGQKIMAPEFVSQFTGQKTGAKCELAAAKQIGDRILSRHEPASQDQNRGL